MVEIKARTYVAPTVQKGAESGDAEEGRSCLIIVIEASQEAGVKKFRRVGTGNCTMSNYGTTLGV